MESSIAGMNFFVDVSPAKNCAEIRVEMLKDAADKIDYGPKVYKLCRELLKNLC